MVAANTELALLQSCKIEDVLRLCGYSEELGLSAEQLNDAFRSAHGDQGNVCTEDAFKVAVYCLNAIRESLSDLQPESFPSPAELLPFLRAYYSNLGGSLNYSEKVAEGVRDAHVLYCEQCARNQKMTDSGEPPTVRATLERAVILHAYGQVNSVKALLTRFEQVRDEWEQPQAKTAPAVGAQEAFTNAALPRTKEGNQDDNADGLRASKDHEPNPEPSATKLKARPLRAVSETAIVKIEEELKVNLPDERLRELGFPSDRAGRSQLARLLERNWGPDDHNPHEVEARVETLNYAMQLVAKTPGLGSADLTLFEQLAEKGVSPIDYATIIKARNQLANTALAADDIPQHSYHAALLEGEVGRIMSQPYNLDALERTHFDEEQWNLLETGYNRVEPESEAELLRQFCGGDSTELREDTLAQLYVFIERRFKGKTLNDKIVQCLTVARKGNWTSLEEMEEKLAVSVSGRLRMNADV